MKKKSFLSPTSTRALRAAAVMSLVLGLGACSHGIQIADHADDYNVSVETAENRMFLRNIIRAAKRRPMYFTRITSISSTLASSIGATPQLPIGSDGLESYANLLTVSTSATPTVTYQVLQDRTFYNGILNAKTKGLLDLFIAQGWSHDILLNVFVENAILVQETKGVDEDGKEVTERNRLCILKNNPDIFEDIAGFSVFVALAKDNLVAKPDGGTPETFGPAMTAKDVGTPKALKNLSETEFPLKELDDGTFRLQKAAGSTTTYKLKFEIKESEIAGVLAANPAADGDLPPKLCPGGLMRRIIQKRLDNEERVLKATGKPAESPGADATITADITLRSAQSMIHYLGQLARVDINPVNSFFDPVRDVPPNDAWRMNTGREIVGDVDVYFDGQLFTIEDSTQDYRDRTMQYLTLVRQVFALNTAADKSPVAPQPIRLITN